VVAVGRRYGARAAQVRYLPPAGVSQRATPGGAAVPEVRWAYLGDLQVQAGEPLQVQLSPEGHMPVVDAAAALGAGRRVAAIARVLQLLDLLGYGASVLLLVKVFRAWDGPALPAGAGGRHGG
jgi:hypothetical protein